MAEFYTDLPPKEKDNLDKTIEKLKIRNRNIFTISHFCPKYFQNEN